MRAESSSDSMIRAAFAMAPSNIEAVSGDMSPLPHASIIALALSLMVEASISPGISTGAASDRGGGAIRSKQRRKAATSPVFASSTAFVISSGRWGSSIWRRISTPDTRPLGLPDCPFTHLAIYVAAICFSGQFVRQCARARLALPSVWFQLLQPEPAFQPVAHQLRQVRFFCRAVRGLPG